MTSISIRPGNSSAIGGGKTGIIENTCKDECEKNKQGERKGKEGYKEDEEEKEKEK